MRKRRKRSRGRGRGRGMPCKAITNFKPSQEKKKRRASIPFNSAASHVPTNRPLDQGTELDIGSKKKQQRKNEARRVPCCHSSRTLEQKALSFREIEGKKKKFFFSLGFIVVVRFFLVFFCSWKNNISLSLSSDISTGCPLSVFLV